MEVIKIRLQAQNHSMADPLDVPKYRNAAHALYTVVKEEGVGALYRGISLTALRQGKSRNMLHFPFSPLQNPTHVIAISPSYHFHMSNTSTPHPHIAPLRY